MSNLEQCIHLKPEEDAKLITHGYEPICVDAQTKKPAATGWSAGEVTLQRISSERVAFPNSSTGLRTGALVGVDIDLANEEHWPKLAELAVSVLGYTPLTRRGSKGVLAAYRNPNPMGKITVRCKLNNKSVTLVEILGRGQQFVAFGIHPRTKQPYQWLGIDHDPDFPVVFSPLTVPLADLPEVTENKLCEFARKAKELLTSLDYQNVKISGDTGERTASKNAEEPVEEAALCEALSYLDAGCAREDYWRVVAGIHAANIVGDDDGGIRRKHTCTWARGELDRYGRYKDGPPPNYISDDDVLKDFNTSAPREGGISVATIFKMARGAGWKGNSRAGGKSGVVSTEKDFGVTSKVVFPDIGNNGVLKATTANARAALEAFGLQCQHDVFHDKLIVGGRVSDQWVGQVTDEIIARLCHMTYKTFKFKPDSKKMRLAVEQLCYQHKFNPVVDYLNGLKWDGVDRIETWLIDHAGAPDTPYVRAISRIGLIAAVRRARRPGCKFDEIIVLEGKEGLNKSSLIELMAGSENFSDQSILAADDRKQQEQMAGVWIYEIADLTGIRNTEVEKIKAFASRQEDRCRPAYGHFLKSQKRQCILVATTNDMDFLQSQTGNRRWWPIPVTKACDLKALGVVRDQLWAEAAQLEKEGASIRLPQELWGAAGQEQEKRRLTHPWEDVLANVTGEKYPIPGYDQMHEVRILSSQVFSDYLLLGPSKLDRWIGKTVKQIMTRLGWTYKGNLRIGSRVGGGYVRTIKGPLPPFVKKP